MITIKPYPSSAGDDFAIWQDSSILAAGKRQWCEGYVARMASETNPPSSAVLKAIDRFWKKLSAGRQ